MSDQETTDTLEVETPMTVPKPKSKPASKRAAKPVVQPSVKLQPIEEETPGKNEESLDVDQLPQKRASPEPDSGPTLQVSREVYNSDSLVCEDDYET